MRKWMSNVSIGVLVLVMFAISLVATDWEHSFFNKEDVRTGQNEKRIEVLEEYVSKIGKVVGNLIKEEDKRKESLSKENSFVSECFELTFYCDSKPGITRSGCPVRTGSVASDPNVIPMGTRIRFIGFPSPIPERGMVDDTGGKVKGNILDVFLWRYEDCVQLGRIQCKASWRKDAIGRYLLIEKTKQKGD